MSIGPLERLITIVMITRNRAGDLHRSLSRLTQLHPGCPVILVDNQSNDDTLAMVRRDFPSVELITLASNAGAVGRNIGVAAARTLYIAFCDDDSWWDAGALTQAVACFETYPRVGAIAGKMLVGDEQRLDYVSSLHAISPLPQRMPMPGPAILSFLGCGVFVRRSAFLEVGGYHPKLRFSGEEWLLGVDLHAAGWGATYLDTLVGRHYPSTARAMPRRYQMGARNLFWGTWLRRPTGPALGKTWSLVRQARRNRNEAIGLLEGLVGIPFLLRNRRVPPAATEHDIMLLEAQNRQLRLDQTAPA